MALIPFKRETVQDVLKSDLIMFPINEHNTHWSMMVIDIRREKLIYVNSLGRKPDTNLFPRVRRWLETACTHAKELYDDRGTTKSAVCRQEG